MNTFDVKTLHSPMRVVLHLLWFRTLNTHYQKKVITIFTISDN